MIKVSNILLVDDHPVFRQGLLTLLEKEKGLKVVGEASDGEIAIEMINKLSPDIVLMDITMPNLDGIEATRKIVSESPHTKVVALSVHSEKRFVRGMFQAGAVGYILKESVPQEMIRGIQAVLAGNAFLSSGISGIVASDYSSLLSESEAVDETSGEPILQTKLHPPPVTADIIPRVRLVELLEEGRDRAMTLISAAPGYGKSILTSQWLAISSCPSAWVSLEESDNDLHEFLMYFLTAVQNTFPSIDLKTQSLLHASNLPPVKVLARYLLNDLDQVGEPFILVLDDYHRIHEETIHNLLIELLRYPPPRMHLALLTRRDPPLPLANLRAYGQITEISAQDLRLSINETSALLERILRETVDADTASVLEDKLEGWVTGLRLAALALGQKKDHSHLLQKLAQSTDLIQDYLIKEVLSHIPKAFARYLMETSILDRFCTSLCEAIRSRSGGAQDPDEELTGVAFIDWLEDTHLFVIPLDAERQWFRYHHMFQELLQDQLTKTMEPSAIAALHTRASEWFESRELIDDALKHSVAAEDMDRAVQIVERHRQATINNDQWYVLEKWLSYMPEEVMQQRAELLLARTWLLMHNFRFDVVLSLLDHIESLLSDDPTHEPLYGEVALCRGYCLFFIGEGSISLELMKEALEKIPVSFFEARAQTEVIFSLSSLMVGRKEQAFRGLDDLLARYDSPQELRKTRLLVTYVFLYYLGGDLHRAELANLELRKVAERGDYSYARAWTHHLQGLIHLQRCEWEAAIEHLEQSVARRFIHFKRTAADSIVGLILAYQALGREDEAQTKIQVFEDYVTSLDDPALVFLKDSAKARLAIMQGRLESAKRWLETVEPPPEGAMLWWLDIPSLTFCRALIAEGSPASLDEAETQLRKWAEMNENHHNSYQLIGIWALQAMVSAKQGKEEEAANNLERALTLAEPGGFIFPFIELGLPMAEMLKHLRKQDVAIDFIEKILTVFERDRQLTLQPEISGRQTGSSAAAENGLLIEDLTPRELEVLTLLAEGLSNKEIGAKLFLSSLTVKKHLYNIYQKLGGHKRLAVVNKARELGILPRN